MTMAKLRIYWVDAGNAAMASALIVIFLRGESYFMTVLFY